MRWIPKIKNIFNDFSQMPYINACFFPGRKHFFKGYIRHVVSIVCC